MVILLDNIDFENCFMSIRLIQVSSFSLSIHVVIRIVCHIREEKHISPGAAGNGRPLNCVMTTSVCKNVV